MTINNKHRSDSTPNPYLSDKSFGPVSRKILGSANQGEAGNTFYKGIMQSVLDLAGCEAAELRVIEHGKVQISELDLTGSRKFRLRLMPAGTSEAGEVFPCLDTGTALEQLCFAAFQHTGNSSLPSSTPHGSFWAGRSDAAEGFVSLAIIPFSFEEEVRGLLLLKSRGADFFNREDIEIIEELAETLAVAIAHWRTHSALEERIKELSCLRDIATVAARPNISLPEILQEAVGLLPRSWQYPDIATARIVCDGLTFAAPGFKEGFESIRSDIVVDGKKRGFIEVSYKRPVREHDEGPFLHEERSLIIAMANEIALVIERSQAEEEKDRLEEQLRHADRLATIGQLAAGVAHELNEPLGNILGFAQLAAKASGIPEAVGKDLDRIISASLHARTVIERLNLFARQSPQRRGLVDLNRVINEGLYFLGHRCAKVGITLVRELASDIPEIIADQSQLYQVLVNLVVNAIQAMPDGGRLTIRTSKYDTQVAFSVEDTGIGIDDETRSKIFLPFFTTKDVNEGTGLGLAVVHGIVTAHGGSITVDSQVGKGSRFEVRLPLSAWPE